MATRIGCDGLVYAKQLTDPYDGPPTYGTVTSAPGVMSLSINPNASMETIFYDDGPGEAASTLGTIEVEIQKNELTTNEKGDLLGKEIDAKGGLVSGDSDVPPWVAVGFRTLKSDGTYRYVWLYKGKFMDPEDASETKGDTINFQSETISGQFARLNQPIEINGRNMRPWKYEVNEGDTDVTELFLDEFFDDVVLPSDT